MSLVGKVAAQPWSESGSAEEEERRKGEGEETGREERKYEDGI